MKRLVGISSLLLSFFLISCASHQTYHTQNGITHFRYPASSGVGKALIQAIKEAGQADEVLDLLHNKKIAKMLFGDETVKLKNIDELENYSFATSNLARILQENNGKLIWKGFKDIDLGKAWKGLQDEASFIHSGIVKTGKEASERGSILSKATMKNYMGKKSYNTPGYASVNKLVSAAVDSKVIAAKEASELAQAYKAAMKEAPENQLIFISNIERHIDTLHITKGELGSIDAASICSTFRNDYAEAVKMNQWAMNINQSLANGKIAIPKTNDEVVKMLAETGDEVINPGSRNIAEMAEGSDEYIRKFDEFNWRKKGLCQTPCKALHNKACKR